MGADRTDRIPQGDAMAPDKHPDSPTRLVCVCGQRMVVDPGMYGQPGKCPACRRKLWMPYAEEVAAFGPVIYVAQHREFLREPGQRVRAADQTQIPGVQADAPQPAPEPREAEGPPDAGPDSADAPPAEPTHPTPVPEKDLAGLPPESEAEPVPQAAREYPAEPAPDAVPAQTLREKSDAGATDSNGEHSPEHAAGPEDRPVDPQPALQILLSAVAHCEARLARLRQDPTAHPDEIELVEGWLRLARTARWKLDREFRSSLVETSDALRAVLRDIGKTVARFRAGSLTPDEYFEKISALRERREILERKRVNLRGWLRAETPEDVGGKVHRDWAEMDFDSVRPEWPAGPSGRGSLLSWITDSLREALRAMREAQVEEEQWLHASPGSGETDLAVRQSGIHDARCLRRMAADRVEFLHQRLREILMDIHTDIEVLNDYGRTAVQKAGGPQTETARAIADRLAAAGADLRRQRAWARDALAALFPEEVPGGPVTLFRNLGAPEGRQRFSIEILPALASAFLFLILAGVAGSWMFAGLFAGMGLLIVPALLLRTLRLRAGGILTLWGVSSIPVGMVVLRGMQQTAAEALPPLMAMAGWLCLGILFWVILRGVPAQLTRFAASATLVLALLAAGIAVQALTASTPVRATEITGRPADTNARAQTTAPPGSAAPPLAPPAISKPAQDNTALPATSETNPDSSASDTTLNPPPLPPAAQIAYSIPIRIPPVVPDGAIDPTGIDASGSDNAAADPAPLTSQITAELRGVLRSENRPPRFKVVFRSPAGEQTVDALLGERLFGLWTAREYNAEDSSLTLVNGGRYVILKKGTPVVLPEAP